MKITRFAAIGCAAVPCFVSSGQTAISWANANNGSWSVAANWTPTNVPDSGAEDAVLGLSAPYSVSMDNSYFVHQLSVGNPLATLLVPQGRVLTVGAGGIDTDGVIVIDSNDGGCCAESYVVFTNGSTLRGNGRVVLGHGSRAVLATGTSGTEFASIDAGVTIGGTGRIQGNFTSQGTIVGGLDPGPTIAARTFTQQGSGRIFVDGDGLVASISGGTLKGGAITTVNGGLFVARGSSRIDAVTITGGSSVYIAQGADLTVNSGGLVNDGNIVVDSNDGGCCGVAYFQLSNTAMVLGTGTITLNHPSRAVLTTTSSGTDPGTLGSGVTLRGSGQITGYIINRGTIAPGVAIGQIDRSGFIEQTPTGVVEIDLKGAAQSERDFIGGTGGFKLGGKLRVRLLNGYILPVGQSYTMISGGTITGTFDVLELPGMPVGQLRVVYGVNTVVLKAVACPSDFNGDGFVNGDDFDAFVGAFEGGKTTADFNKDGFVTGDDFDGFVDAYTTGC